MVEYVLMSRTNSKSREMVKAAIPLTVILVIALTASGCTTVSNLFTGKTTTTTESSAPKGPSAKELKVLPNDAPGYDLKDMPRYPGSIRQSFTIVKGDNGKSSGNILYQTAESAYKVETHYEKQIDKYDWKLEELIITDDGQIYRLSKGSRKVSVNVARREGIKFTDISYIYREY